MSPPALYKLSVSRLKDFVRCNRLPAWSHFTGERSPQHPSAHKGEMVHKVVEMWLRDGVMPDLRHPLGQIAAAAMPFLPDRNTPHLEVETSFEVALTDRAILRGRMDASTKNLVVDLKTTGNAKWALTSEDLRDDLQALGYAYALHAMGLTDGHVDLRWVYTLTGDQRKGWAAETRLEAPDVKAGHKRLQVLADDYAAAFDAAKNPMDLPGNYDACNDYGGCFWKKYCHANNPPADHPCTSPKEEPTVSKPNPLDLLLSKKMSSGAAKSAPVVATTPPGGNLAAVLPPLPVAPPAVAVLPPEAPAPLAVLPEAPAKPKRGKKTGIESLTDAELWAEADKIFSEIKRRNGVG